MHRKRKLVSVAVLLVLIVATIFGSFQKMPAVEGEVQETAQFSDKETIYLWYSDDSMTDYLHSATVSFGEQREDARVIPLLVSNSEYLEEIHRGTMAAEQTPDLYLLSNDSLEKAYLAGLASQVQEEEGFCTPDNFPQAALDAVTYQGKILGYPMFYETSALVYNQSYLEQWATQQAEKEIVNSESEEVNEETGEPVSGGELDTAEVEAKAKGYLEKAVPSTMDDILNIADTFDAPEQVEGIMKWDVSDIFYNYWFVGKYMVVGGDAGDDLQQIDIDNEKTISCLKVYQALNQFFSIESDTVSYDSVVQDFIDGKILFTIGTTDVAAKLAAAKEEGTLAFEYGIAPMPQVSKDLESRALSVTNAVVVNGFSEKKELANEFAIYLTREYADYLYEATGRPSANRNVSCNRGPLQMFFEEYEESVSLPKMMETGNFWMQLEVLFAKVWNGEDATVLIKELSDNILLQAK